MYKYVFVFRHLVLVIVNYEYTIVLIGHFFFIATVTSITLWQSLTPPLDHQSQFVAGVEM